MTDFYSGSIFNAYPDSIGNTLGDVVNLLGREEYKDAFSMFYVLPSVFNTDLDRGFSIISYDLNELFATPQNIEDIKSLNIELVMDFVLNHLSVLSPQFQSIINEGDESPYRDFFIDWNKFWDGCGQMTEEGYIQPDKELIKNMFFRKPGLPILMVRFPDGKDIPYWNTFYQEVSYTKPDPLNLVCKLGLQYGSAMQIADMIGKEIDAGRKPEEMDFGQFNTHRHEIVGYLEEQRHYLGQMDVNITSPLVWDFYRETLKKLADYGVSIVRLDAFAYASKKVGARNFLNDPEVWELLDRVNEIAMPLGLTLLPEIHASYEEGTYRVLTEKGYAVYDFFLPGLVIDAFRRETGEVVAQWANEIISLRIKTVNMLGCHDGIPLLDLKGLLDDDTIQELIEVVVSRGGIVKNLHGEKNVYYQVNASYFSALGESNKVMLAARALQMFMPGIPQIWYLDLFNGKNDYERMHRAGTGGHKEINRTNLSLEYAIIKSSEDSVKNQLRLLQMRNTCGVFTDQAHIEFSSKGCELNAKWQNDCGSAELNLNFKTANFHIEVKNSQGLETYTMIQ